MRRFRIYLQSRPAGRLTWFGCTAMVVGLLFLAPLPLLAQADGSFCERNPDAPECQSPTDAFCRNNPDAPECLPAFDPDADFDRDGLPDSQDACPDTPAGTRPLRDGCSAVDVVFSAKRFAEDVREALDAAVMTLRAEPELSTIVRSLVEAQTAVVQAASLMTEGEVCQSSHRYDAALSRLRAASLHMRRTIPRLSRQYTTASLKDTSRLVDDVPDGTLQSIFLKVRANRLDAAVADAEGVGRVFSAACGAVQGPTRLRRQLIVNYEDARRLITLADGSQVAIPPALPLEPGPKRREAAGDVEGAAKNAGGGGATTAIYQGGLATASGIRFQDGSGLVKDVAVGPAVAEGSGEAPQLQCMRARLAPVQYFYVANSQLTFHKLSSYETGEPGVSNITAHFLEQGMRFGAERLGVCKFNSGGNPSTRYSLRLEVAQGWSSNKTVLAQNLTENGAPVPILPPPIYDSNQPAKLTVIVQQQTCQNFGFGNILCSAPEPMAGHTEVHDVVIRPRGAYCTAQYAESIHSLEDHEPLSFEENGITSINDGLLFSAINDANPAFQALSYKVNGSSSSFPNLQVIQGSQPFAVHTQDPSGSFSTQQKLHLKGVTGAKPGVIWPKAAGTRSGEAVWYSCKVPDLKVRDLIHDCGSSTPSQTFYRLPFYPGGYPEADAGANDPWNPWHTVGNWNPSGTGHGGKDQNGNPNPPGLQQYAWDIGSPHVEGLELRAARGGRVVEVKSDSKGNDAFCWNNDPEPYTNCDIGNYVIIEHQDDTYGVYFHFKENGGVFVAAGQQVTRGQPIGLAGNSGASGGPHLHFHVQGMPGVDSSPSIPVSFEARQYACSTVDGKRVCNPTSSLRTCFKPVDGSAMFSTNDVGWLNTNVSSILAAVASTETPGELDHEDAVVAGYELSEAYPNPFNPRTSVGLALEQAQTVEVSVYDLIGRRVSVLHDGMLNRGRHRFIFEAGSLPSGVYIIHALGEEFSALQKVVLMK